MKKACFILIGSLLILMLGAGAVSLRRGAHAPTGLSAPLRRPNFILISIDTLRADRLESFGYARRTSPGIANWAKQGVLFKNVAAESCWTLPSHVTMLSGLHPLSHGVNRGKLSIARETPLLAEMLRKAGYRTMAFTGQLYLSAVYGFDRGFDLYQAKREDFAKTAKRIEKALDGLAAHSPFFLFVHTYQVHSPYAAPLPYRDMFKSKDAEFFDLDAPHAVGRLNTPQATAGQLKYVSDRYDGSIRWTDEVLSKLFVLLTRKGLMQNTYVILTSDHGEAFREHGVYGHQNLLNREVLFVPLIINGPGLAPREVSAPVGLMDITPTVLELAGLEGTGQLDGKSLQPLLLGQGQWADSRRRVSYFERKYTLRSLLDNQHHLIFGPQAGQVQLYNLALDPEERHDLSNSQTKLVKALSIALAEEEGRIKRVVPSGEKVELDSAEIENLKTLGYAD